MKTKLALALLLTLIASSLMAGQANVVLNWTLRPASENVTSYLVYEELSPGKSLVATVSGSISTATITNVANGEHTYFVAGTNSGTPSNFYGEGLPSQKFTVTIYNYPIASPGVPANLTGNVNYFFP